MLTSFKNTWQRRKVNVLYAAEEYAIATQFQKGSTERAQAVQ